MPFGFFLFNISRSFIKPFESFVEAAREYIGFCSNERIQQKAKWMPPVMYREASIFAA